MKPYVALIISAGAALALSGAGLAQPSGGPDAKGNAPLKASHTIDDGAPKPGANSFTEGQARQHMLNSGYSSVSALTKGPDGVWRGTAMKGTTPVKVAMDFKGNVTEAAAAPAATAVTARSTSTGTHETMTSAATTGAATATTAHRHGDRHAARRHRVDTGAGVPGRSGVGKSGIDRNHNGVSDKEDRAHDAVVH